MYNLNWVNKGAFAKSGTLNVRSDYNNNSAILYSASDFAGVLTGTYYYSGGYNWLQLLSVSPISIYGYVREDVVNIEAINPIDFNTAQARINQMLDNDAQTLTNLLQSAQLCRLLEKKGINVSSHKKNIKRIYLSLYNRNQKLLASPSLKDKRKGESPLSEFAPALQNIVGDNSIGLVISTTALLIIVVAALVVGAMAVYYTFETEARAATADIKASKETLEILSKLSPEDRKVVEEDTQRQIKEAYNKGKLAGFTWIDFIKYAAVAAGTFYVIKIAREKI